jgi:predicted RNase H-like HicB family nuclease
MIGSHELEEHFMSPYQVKAEWDEEAGVWVASSDDVPGLATGADTVEALIEKLKVVIPELLEANGLLPAGVDDVPFAIVAERTEHARRVA